MPRDSFDWTLFLTASVLAVVGVVNLYSATSVVRAALTEIYIQQVYWLVLGGILGAVVAVIDYRHYERLGYLLYGIGIVFLVLVFILGKDIRGSSRWIAIGSFGFQPSEFMKLFLIIALAKYLHDDPRTEARGIKDLVPPAILTAIPTFLVLKQPDLGTALVHLLIFVTICLLTKIRWQTIAGIVVGAGIALPVLWTYVLKDYQKQRVYVYLDPDAYIRGLGYQAHHARVAIGAGGWKGEGFMQGTQNQFNFLPDQYSDFPFPVFAEEWGFLGSFVLVSLYGFLVLWAIRIAATAKDRFGAVLAIGVGAMIFWHALFNLGMATGLLPVVGVPLPLFSFGGSSVLTMMLGIGLLMNVSMRRYWVSPSRTTGLLLRS